MTIYGELINHPRHPEHKLELKHEERPYMCDGCHQIGFRARYRCDEPFEWCNFHLHKDCATPKDTITHKFYPGRVFHFLKLPAGPDRHCDACAQDIIRYNYHCFDHELDLHPSCAKLLDKISVEGGESLKLKLQKKTSSKCYKCGTKDREYGRKSWSYVSSGKECHLHVACVKEMLLDSWENECLPARFGDQKMEMEATDEKALARREPKLHIVIDKMKRSSGKYAKYKKIVKIAVTFIMAAIVGDPTALVIGLFSSLLTH